MSSIDKLEVVPPSMLQTIAQAGTAALIAMRSALQASGSGNAPQSMKNSVYSLNSLASTLLSSAQALMPGDANQSGQGQGMMGGLKKLSGKQAAINAATGELLRQMLSEREGDGPGGKKPGNGREGKAGEEARRAAQKAQQELADQLGRLSEKYEKESSESLNKRVKELEEEARRIAAMLDDPSLQVQERQDRFLSRMLQTTLSLHKQDEGKQERKSNAAVTVFDTREDRIPLHNDLLNKTDTYYKLRMQAMEGNFPESYRSNVQAYFDSLGVLFLK
jgi:hypothetical protein